MILVIIIKGKMQGKTLKAQAEIPFSAAEIKTLLFKVIITIKAINKIVIKKLNFLKKASNYLTK